MEHLKAYRILYAEDEAIIRMGLTPRLESYFKEVYVAKDGEEALTQYRKQNPDALLLDIEMPYKNGLEIAQEIRKENKDIPIILLSAYTKKQFMEESLMLDIFKYLVKPIKEDELQDTLAKLSKKLSA